MKLEDIRKLALALSKSNKGTNVSNYSLDGTVLTTEAMNETLKHELFELCKDEYAYELNKIFLFKLIGESIDAKLPPELEKFFMGVSKVVQYGEQDKPEVTVRRPNKNLRARAFVTKVSPAGVYEVFRLTKEGKFTIEMSAIGGAAQIAFEDFLTGRIDWNEMLEVIALGMEDRIYDEILANLAKVEASLPTANKAESATFDPKALNKVLDIVSIYGAPTIFCTETFAREITEGADWASEQEKVARRNVGYLANYKGAKIVIMPQSYTDETHAVKVVDSSKAYIMPAGREPIFHVALQGNTHVREIPSQSDWSKEIQTYKKFGVASFVYNDIGTYTITSLRD